MKGMNSNQSTTNIQHKERIGLTRTSNFETDENIMLLFILTILHIYSSSFFVCILQNIDYQNSCSTCVSGEINQMSHQFKLKARKQHFCSKIICKWCIRWKQIKKVQYCLMIKRSKGLSVCPKDNGWNFSMHQTCTIHVTWLLQIYDQTLVL